MKLLASYAGNYSTSHTVTFTEPSAAGSDVIMFLITAAVPTFPAGWVVDRSAVPGDWSGVVRLPGASNAGISSVTFTLAASRAVSAVVVEDYVASVHYSDFTKGGSPLFNGGTQWGTGAHTWAQSGSGFPDSVYSVHWATRVATPFDGRIASLDNGFALLGQNATGAAANECHIIGVGHAQAVSFAANGVTATQSPVMTTAPQPTSSKAGLISYVGREGGTPPPPALPPVAHSGFYTLPTGTTAKTATFDFTPTAGNMLVLFASAEATFTGVQAGWTQRANQTVGVWVGGCWTKISDGTETSFSWTQNGARPATVAVFEIRGATGTSVGTGAAGAVTFLPGLTPANDTGTAATPYGRSVLLRYNANCTTISNPAVWSNTPSGEQVETGEAVSGSGAGAAYGAAYYVDCSDGSGATISWAAPPDGTLAYAGCNLWVQTVAVAGGDTAPPTITARTPASGATNVGIGTKVDVTFSETVTGETMVLKQGASVVPTTKSGTGASRTLTPSSPLSLATVYTVEVSGAQDGFGNTMVADSWTFTTMATTNAVAEENALPGSTDHGSATVGRGAVGYLGYAKQFSVDAGQTVQFSVDGTAAASIDIYRIGSYGGLGWRKVATVANSPTTQAGGVVVANTNGATSMAAWSATASWAVPSGEVSGLHIGVVKDSGGVAKSWIPFNVRNDARAADIVVVLADATWGAAYNYFGDRGTEFTGKSTYGTGQSFGSIGSRSLLVSYDRPVVTRGPTTGEAVVNHWDNHEAPLIDWLESSGYNVKYISCYDLDQQASKDVIGSAKVLLVAGHNEYWSQGMWDNAEAFSLAGGHLVFMSGNDVFWRIRWADSGRTFWCQKDTAPGPDTHVAGTPLDPVSWTGTWRDTRWADRKPENLLNGTFFRMNGVRDETMTVNAATYGTSPFWRGTTVASGTDLSVAQVIGFEANSVAFPNSGGKRLAATSINIDGAYADDNGQTYNGNGTLDWGVAMFQRAPGSGYTVGFGTCQWQWGLSNRHRRGSTVASTAVQRATANLLSDLGARPVSAAYDPAPVALSSYGAAYAAPLVGGASIWRPTVPASVTSGPSETNPLALATRFQVAKEGPVTALWYYKHTAVDQSSLPLWLFNASVPALLASGSVSPGTGTGWFQVQLTTPVTLTPGVVYAVAGLIPVGVPYSYSTSLFAGGSIVSGDLTALGGSLDATGVANQTTGWGTSSPGYGYPLDVSFGATPAQVARFGIGTGQGGDWAPAVVPSASWVFATVDGSVAPEAAADPYLRQGDLRAVVNTLNGTIGWQCRTGAGTWQTLGPAVLSVPDTRSTRAEIIAWLAGRGVTLTDEALASMTAPELLALVASVLD